MASRSRLIPMLLVALVMQLGGGAGSIRSAVSAAAATVFGPKTYVRATGTPVVETNSFTTASPGAYTLRIFNGGSPATYDLVSSAVITLNGIVVASPSDFPGSGVILKPVTLAGVNTISVELRSKPGSALTLEIAGESSGNRSPIADAGADQTTSVGATITLDGHNSSDPDGDALTFAWSFVSRPSGSVATLSDPAAVAPTFVVDRPGSYVVQLIVNDGTVNSAADTVTISTVNSAPVANAGPDQTLLVGATATLNGGGSHDVDGDPLTYRWTLASRPAGSSAALVNATSVAPTFTVDAPGTYVAQLIVNDGHVDSAADTVAISTTNSSPVADAGADQSARVGDAVTLDGSASHDADGDPIQYRWSFVTRPAGSAAALSNPAAVSPTFVVDVAGTYVAQLIVNDGLVDSAADTVSISTINTKPVANAGPDQLVTVGNVVTLDGTASSDADHDPLTYRWAILTRPAGSTTALSNPADAQPTFVADAVGSFLLQLIVNDGQVDSDADTVAIDVRSTTVAVPNVVGLPLTDAASIIAGSDLRVGVVTNEYSAAIAVGSVIRQSPLATTIVLRQSTVDLVVSLGPAPNSAPTANAGADQTVHTGDLVTLDGTSSNDPDGDPLTYAWTLLSAPVGSVATLSNAAAAQPTIAIDRPGTYIAQLIVNDGTVDSVPDTVTISTTNSAPVANAGVDQTAPVTATVTLDGSASHDADGDALTYAWAFSSKPAGSLAVLVNPASVAPGFTIDVPGSYVVQLIVNDGTVDSAADTIAVSTINSAPVADAGPDQTTQVTRLVTLDGSRSHDVDGDALSYRWSLTSVPAGSMAMLSSASAVGPTFTADAPGTYVVQLIVNDGTVDGAADTVTISTTNSPPVADAGPDATAVVGGVVTLDGSASHDVDGDALTYAWSLTSRPAGSAAVLSDPAAVAPLFTIDLPGTYVAQLIVNDGTVDSAADTITISTTNSAPVASAGPDQTAPVGTLVTLDGSASHDADSDALTYHWSFTSRPAGSAAVLSDPATAMPTFTIDEPGTYVVQLVVNDGTVDSAADLVTISTSNSKPVANAGADQTVDAGSGVMLDGTASSDADHDPLTFNWSIITRPATSIAALSDPHAAQPTFVADLAGTYVVQLIVNDGTVDSDPDTVRVDAVAVNVVVPSFTGLSRADAEAAIVAAGLTVGNVTFANDNVVPAGFVISQSPAAGTPLPPLTPVDLVVSLGPGVPVLQSIAVSPTPLSLARGQTQQYSAVGTFSDGHVEDFTATATWSSSDIAVAFVNAAGLVEARGAGGAAIRAAFGGVTGSAALTVNGAALASIVVTPVSPIVVVGSTQAFSAIGVLTDGTSMSLAGQVTWGSTDATKATINAAGVATGVAAGPATITATNGAISGSTLLTVQTKAAGDTTLPTAAITSPANNSAVTSAVNIVGSASDANFSRYVLEYAPAGSTAFTTITTGTAPVANGVLGVLDPTVLINDLYTVQLRVIDRNNNVTTTSRTYQVARDAKVGNFSLKFQDLAIPLAGLPITVNRVYDSRDKGVGDFGVGWRLDIKTVRLRTNRVLGTAWQQTSSGGFIPTYCIVGTDEHKVSITLFDGRVAEFDMAPSPQCQQVIPLDFLNGVTFTPRAGTQGTLVALDVPLPYFDGGVGPGQLLDTDTFEVINPQRFQYTTADGYVFIINKATGVESARDPNGNTITFGANGITHSSGKSVAFTRDAQGRITKITGPTGDIHQYAYDTNGDLASSTDPAANVTQYFYNFSHGLLEIRDPRGIRPVRNEFDDSGRLVATIDALGNRITYAHDLAASHELVTDRLGRVTLVEYDGVGNVTRETRSDGTVITRTYDGRGNVLTDTDALGGTITRTYNALDQVLTKRNQLGQLVESYTYDSAARVLTFTDARGNVTTNVYDTHGNRTKMTDGAGKVTQWTYDASGNLLTETSPLGGVTTNVYDGSGNLTRTTDPLGNVTQFTYDAAGRKLTDTRSQTVNGVLQPLVTTYTYDADGRLTKTTLPDGSTKQSEYDAVGNLTASIDQLAHRTTYDYDASNRRIRTTFPDGTTEQQQYDAEGQLVAKIDRGGLTTAYTYDAMGRVKRIIAPDGTFTERGYDNAGRASTFKDQNAGITSTEYDAAARLTRVVDPAGAETLRTYDAFGNQVTERDAAGHVTTMEYDARNLLTRKVFPNGSEERYTYDAAGNPATTIDQDGHQTAYIYDAAGHMTRVTDALGSSWNFAYDEAGNRKSQTDPLGHVTQFQYDAFGRETRRALPGGLFQSRTYDAAGNLTQRADYGGAVTTYLYDVMNRLTRRNQADGSTAIFTYTPTGQRATAQDARGVTAYAYDVRDRVSSLTQPDGPSLAYAYDGTSNVTSLGVTSGGTTAATTYTYGPADRLLTVADPEAGAFTYTYSSTAKVSSLAFPNGLTTQYAYSVADRLTSITTQNGAAATIQSFAYTLSPGGRRTQIDELGGVARAMTFDAAGHLTREAVTNGGAAVYTDDFTYDAAGNRTRLDHAPAGGAVQTRLFTYDDRDRMLTDDGVAFTWDANGQLLTKSGANGIQNIWDSEGRLIHVLAADGSSTAYEYDVDGNRVKTTVFPAGGGAPQVTRYVVDTRGGLSHVVAELDGGGAITARYVRARDQLLAVARPGGVTRYYHADAIGSVRALSDATGAITDAYSYDAFGTLTSHTGTDPNPYLYAGEPVGALGGIYYLRARWMDPSSGRFLSVDPKEGVPEQPRTLHRYLYAGGDPVNAVDPSGLQFSVAEVDISLSIEEDLASIEGVATRGILERVREQLARITVNSVKALQKVRQAGQQTHHLIEQRLWQRNPVLQRIWTSVDEMPGVNLSAAEHQLYTNAWRAAFPYSNQVGYLAEPTLEEIMTAAQRIYANNPALFNALFRNVVEFLL